MAHRSFQGLLRLFCLRFFCNYPGSYESWAVLGEPMHFRTPIEHPLVINYDGISLAGAGEHRSQQFRPEHVINVPVAHPIAVIPATPVYLYTPIPAWLSPTGYFQAGTSQPYSASERPSIAPRSGVLTRHPASFPAATVLIPHQQSPGIPMHPIWQGRQQNMRPQHAIYGSRLTAASVAKPPSETLEIPGNSGDKFAPQIDPCTIAFKRSPVAPEFISSSKIVNPPEKFSPIPVKEAPTCSQRETNSEVKVSKTLSSVSSVESDFMRTPTNPKTPTLVSNDASTRTSVPKSSEPNSTAHVNQPGAPSSRGKEFVPKISHLKIPKGGFRLLERNKFPETKSSSKINENLNQIQRKKFTPDESSRNKHLISDEPSISQDHKIFISITKEKMCTQNESAMTKFSSGSAPDAYSPEGVAPPPLRIGVFKPKTTIQNYNDSRNQINSSIEGEIILKKAHSMWAKGSDQNQVISIGGLKVNSNPKNNLSHKAENPKSDQSKNKIKPSYNSENRLSKSHLERQSESERSLHNTPNILQSGSEPRVLDFQTIKSENLNPNHLECDKIPDLENKALLEEMEIKIIQDDTMKKKLYSSNKVEIKSETDFQPHLKCAKKGHENFLSRIPNNPVKKGIMGDEISKSIDDLKKTEKKDEPLERNKKTSVLTSIDAKIIPRFSQKLKLDEKNSEKLASQNSKMEIKLKNEPLEQEIAQGFSKKSEKKHNEGCIPISNSSKGKIDQVLKSIDEKDEELDGNDFQIEKIIFPVKNETNDKKKEKIKMNGKKQKYEKVVEADYTSHQSDVYQIMNEEIRDELKGFKPEDSQINENPEKISELGNKNSKRNSKKKNKHSMKKHPSKNSERIKAIERKKDRIMNQTPAEIFEYGGKNIPKPKKNKFDSGRNENEEPLDLNNNEESPKNLQNVGNSGDTQVNKNMIDEEEEEIISLDIAAAFDLSPIQKLAEKLKISLDFIILQDNNLKNSEIKNKYLIKNYQKNRENIIHDKEVYKVIHHHLKLDNMKNNLEINTMDSKLYQYMHSIMDEGSQKFFKINQWVANQIEKQEALRRLFTFYQQIASFRIQKSWFFLRKKLIEVNLLDKEQADDLEEIFSLSGPFPQLIGSLIEISIHDVFENKFGKTQFKNFQFLLALFGNLTFSRRISPEYYLVLKKEASSKLENRFIYSKNEVFDFDEFSMEKASNYDFRGIQLEEVLHEAISKGVKLNYLLSIFNILRLFEEEYSPPKIGLKDSKYAKILSSLICKSKTNLNIWLESPQRLWFVERFTERKLHKHFEYFLLEFAKQNKGVNDQKAIQTYHSILREEFPGYQNYQF